MRVLLTHPVVDLIKKAPCLPDLGLGYIAAALTDNHDVQVLDWNMTGGISGFKSVLHKFKPEVCGLKIFTKDIAAATETVRIIRRTLPNCTVVLGGPHPSCTDPDDVMSIFQESNYAFRGEVEHIFPDFLNKLHNNTDVSGTPGLIWRENGTVRHNLPSFIETLDDLQDPAWELINPQRYSHAPVSPGDQAMVVAPIVTTRGCPGRCTFCSAWRVNGRVVRKRNPERVVDEMERLYHHFGVHMFNIVDNCFTSDADHFEKICEGLLRSKHNLEWDCNSFERLSNLDREHLELMYRAGCRRLQVGVESASDDTRQTINKHVEFSEYERVIQEAKRIGMGVTAWFILGFPDETKKAMQNTVRRAYQLSADELSFTQCFPLPGSAVHKQWKNRYNLGRIDWAVYNVGTSQYALSELSSRKLLWFTRCARVGLKLRRRSQVLGNLWVRLFV